MRIRRTSVPALALVAARLATRPPGGAFTFGLRRAEILSAQVNGAALLALALLIAVDAVRRLSDPTEAHHSAHWASPAAAADLLADPGARAFLARFRALI